MAARSALRCIWAAGCCHQPPGTMDFSGNRYGWRKLTRLDDVAAPRKSFAAIIVGLTLEEVLSKRQGDVAAFLANVGCPVDAGVSVKLALISNDNAKSGVYEKVAIPPFGNVRVVVVNDTIGIPGKDYTSEMEFTLDNLLAIIARVDKNFGPVVDAAVSDWSAPTVSIPVAPWSTLDRLAPGGSVYFLYPGPRFVKLPSGKKEEQSLSGGQYWWTPSFHSFTSPTFRRRATVEHIAGSPLPNAKSDAAGASFVDAC